MSEQRKNMGHPYINEFHRQWNEACMKTNERIKSTSFSREQLKEQSKRLKEAVEKASSKSNT